MSAALLWGLLAPPRSIAQSLDLPWSGNAVLFEGERIDAPTIVTDQMNGVHALWAGREEGLADGSPDALYYACWDGEAWSPPVDVLLSPDRVNVTFPEAVIDTHGVLHAIWAAGAKLYYSRVGVGEAGNPWHWAEPVRLSDSQVVVTPSDIVLDSAGGLHVLFADGNSSVFHLMSANGGVSWSAPDLVSQPSPRMGSATVQAGIDSLGNLHVVWMEVPLPEGYPPQGVWYSHSVDGGVSWSSPLPLAGVDFGEPAIAVSPLDDALHVAYNGRVGVGGKYHLMSMDGGKTWSDPVAITAPGEDGLEGHPSLAVDDAGNVYFANDERLAARFGSAWTPALRITSSPLRFVEQASLALVGGNQLHVLYHDGRVQLNHILRILPIDAIPQLPFEKGTEGATEAQHNDPSDDTVVQMLVEKAELRQEAIGYNYAGSLPVREWPFIDRLLQSALLSLVTIVTAGLLWYVRRGRV